MIHTAFSIILETLLSMYQIMLLAICTTQEKKIIIMLRKICFQGIRTRTLQSVRTKTLLSTSTFSKKSIFNAALCRFTIEPTQTVPLVTPKYLYQDSKSLGGIVGEWEMRWRCLYMFTKHHKLSYMA